jgi:4a-hydroxytetrahydrobiopterin dehydratase
VESRHEIIAAADLPGRLAVLDGWYGDTVGISKTYAIGYDDAIRTVGEIGHAAVELDHRPNLDIR